MGVDLVATLQPRREAIRQVLRERVAKSRPRISTNAMVGMGLWLLLWLGYNTDWGYLYDPNFPVRTADLIHCIRAFFPMLAGWLSMLIIMSRPSRTVAWVAGPLGLLLIYALTGLIATPTFQDNPLGGLYFGTNYLAMVLVLLAIVPVEDPLPDIRQVLNFSWGVGLLITLGLLGAVPFLGAAAAESTGGPVGMRAYARVDDVMGMAGTRNTGFARYAAISALVVLPWLWRDCSRRVRVVCALLFGASMYALVLANGRTEIVAFIFSAFVILLAEKSKRTLFLIVGAGAAVLLALKGFFGAFFLYFTRTGQVDGTLSGRTATWDDALRYLSSSPLVGLGFQADRAFLGMHMHNAFLHVFFQAGLLGGGAILIAIGITWGYLIKYFFLRPPEDRSLIPAEIPAVFLFVTISSATESTFAYFSAAWLLSAPIVAYVMALDRRMRKISRRAYLEWRMRVAARNSRRYEPAIDLNPEPAEEEVSP